MVKDENDATLDTDENAEKLKSSETDTADDGKKEDDLVVKAVAERLKFFFSDANIRQDRFMQKYLMQNDKGEYEPIHNNKKGTADEEQETEPGYIKIESLLRFNTIKRHTEDAEIVVKAVKGSCSEFLALNKDETAIKRVEPFRRNQLKDNIPITLVVKNLPLVEKENGNGFAYKVTVDEIRDLFDPKYGGVALVKVQYGSKNNNGDRRGPKVALGSALVEFDSHESFQKAKEDTLTFDDGADVEPKTKLQLGDQTLQVITYTDYLKEEKTDEKKGDEQEAEQPAFKPFTIDWKPHCVIKLKGLSAELCTREMIMETIFNFLEVDDGESKKIAYADYSKGQNHGAIRFSEPSDKIDELARKLKEGEIEIAGSKVESAYVLEGEEETNYWNDFIAFKNKQQQHMAEERKNKRSRSNNNKHFHKNKKFRKK